MTTRSRIIITAAITCHLLLASSLVTSQTPPPTAETTKLLPSAPTSQVEEEVTMKAIEQEKEDSIYHLRGKAEIYYRTYLLQADQITYNADTGDSELEGHVVLDGGPYDEHVESTHGTYNIRSEVGTFYDAAGTLGFKGRRSRYVLTTSNPFAFTGKIVEKHGPTHYLVRRGTVTTCELPHPKWQFRAQEVSVDVDSTAKLYHSDFRLMGIPVFYVPYGKLPVQETRQSGIEMPLVGNSSTKGYILGDSVYWVFNRSTDATAGAEYFSRRGWAQLGQFRMRSSENSYIFFTYSGVVDRGIETGGVRQNQGGEDAYFIADHPFGSIRGAANIDYLSSFVYRIAFTDVYSQAIDSEVKSQVFLSNTTAGFHFNLLAERYQNFDVCVPQTGTNTGCTAITSTELIRILHAPSFFVTGEERRLGNTPLYWSFDAAAEGLQRREISGFRTAALVGRFDLAPTFAMPFEWQGWSIRPSVTLRDTAYTERLDLTTNTAESNTLNRRSLEATFDLRLPAVAKVWERPWLRRKWKHAVEPYMRYRYVDGISNFADILRFDAADVLTNTNEIQFGVVNRIYAKRVDPNASDCDVQGMSTLNVGGPPQVGAVPWEAAPLPEKQPCASGPREILSWEVAQKYFFDPTFGNTLVPGMRNVFASTVDFTGIAFLNQPRRFAPIISRLRVETSPRTNTEWDLDYDPKTGRINGSTALVNYHYGPFTVGGGDAFLRVLDSPAGTAETDFHQFRILAGYGQLNKRGLSAAASFGFDANQGNLQYATLQSTYNWDCCGLSVEYSRFALGAVRNENLYRFSFTLSNVATFGNLRRQERLY